MRPRNAVLASATVAIAAACVYKATRTYEPADPQILEERCAVTNSLFFLLPDQHRPMRFIKLEAYLGRHPVLLVFYDGDAGAERNPVLVRLRRDSDELNAAGVKVFGISTAIPQDNRPADKRRPRPKPNQPRTEFPFPLLTDVPPACKVHRQWGRYDKSVQRPTQGVFLIHRAGWVTCNAGIPKPLTNADAAIDRLLE